MRFSWFSFFFKEGYRKEPHGWLYYIFVIAALFVSGFALWLGSIGNMDPYYYSVVFLTGILPIALITTRISSKETAHPSAIDNCFAVLILISGIHLIAKMEVLLSRIRGLDPLSLVDYTAAFILILAVLELCRRTLGFGLTALLLVGIGYVFWGHHIPGTFGHREIELSTFLETMVFTTDGIFGAPVQVAATYAFLFVTFGHFFQKAGAGQFIFDIAAALVGKKVGGIAKVTVTTAAAFGSISGSPSSDVATTGSINIPIMKKRGYTPVFAGAVESAAATGGTILPPVMGSVAFLMVEFTGIPYAEIVKASVLGAILYYLGIYFQVHFRSVKNDLVGLNDEDIPSVKATLKTGFYYIIPVIVLIWAMEKGFTPSLAAVYGIIAVFIVSFFRRSTWIRFKQLIEIFTDVVYSIAPLTVATAAAGIIIGVINLTGMAGKITALIFSMTGGNLILSLIAAAIICILLGMGMPTPSVYVLVAALIAPALIQLGLDVLPAHLFLIFFSALSAITPPVGVAAYTAAGIAQANPIAIGLQATKLAAVGFIVPFMFVFQPSLLLQGDIWVVLISVVTAIIGVYFLAAGIEGYLRQRLKTWEQIALIVLSIGLILPNWVVSAVSLLLIAVLYFKGYPNPKAIEVKN